MATSTILDIKGMHCGACVGRVTNALRPFADSVTVTLNPPRAVLTGPHAAASLEAMQKAVAAAGTYTASSVMGLASAETPSSRVGHADQPVTRVTPNDETSGLSTYWPLIVIIGYIAVVAIAGTSIGPSMGTSIESSSATPLDDESNLGAWMTNVMAGFFLVFSAFKFFDLTGFANAYASYDLLAKRWPTYGYIYPFLELALGLGFLFRFAPDLTNTATLVLMTFSSLGVLNALRNGQKIQCACLGTVLKLPMSTVTLVEDVAMATMAAVMLLS